MSKLIDAIGQFTTVPNTVVKMIRPMGADAFALWCYLRYRTNSESGVAFPQYETIRNDTGLSYRKIASALRKLESLDLMTRKKRFGNSSEYTMICPPIPTPIDSIVLHPLKGESYQRVQTIKTDTIKTDTINISPNGEKLISFEEPKPHIPRTTEQVKSGILKAMGEYEETQGTRAGVASPLDNERQWKNYYAPIIAAIMGRDGMPISTDRTAARRWYNSKVIRQIPRDKLDELLTAYSNGGGEQFRKPSKNGDEPNPFWIQPQLEKDCIEILKGEQINAKQLSEQEDYDRRLAEELAKIGIAA